MYEKIKDFQLLLVALLISLSFIFSVFLVTKTIKNETIMVTGSAYQLVKSDIAVLKVSLKTKNYQKSVAYNQIKAQIPKVKDFLIKEEFNNDEITILPPHSYPSYRYENQNGYSANIFDGYNFEQTIQIKSTNVDKIKDLAISAQALLDVGIDVNINPPEYYYSKLGEIKISLLKEASEDAKQRAKGMLSASNNRVGKISSVKMGVFQITPVDSTAVSDYGMNDTTSIDKKVTAVANVIFSID